MDKPNYMDIKEIADFTISRIALDILKGYSDELITEYLEKYECQNIKELVYLFLCKSQPSDLNISLNMRQKIKNISEEVTQTESENEQKNLKILQIQSDKNELAQKLELLQSEQKTLLQNVQEVIQINKTLTMKLLKKNQSDLGL